MQGSRPQQEKLLFQTTTLYVGNMSFYTTEDQLYELFRKVSATTTTSTLPSHLRGAAVRAVWQGTVSATTSTIDDLYVH